MVEPQDHTMKNHQASPPVDDTNIPVELDQIGLPGPAEQMNKLIEQSTNKKPSSPETSNDDEVWFTPPPSRAIVFETPKSKVWEVWVELLQESPNKWGKLPSRNVIHDRRELAKIPGVEVLVEDKELYARWTLPKPSSPQPVPSPIAVDQPPVIVTTNLRTTPNAHLQRPAIEPLGPGGLDSLFDDENIPTFE